MTREGPTVELARGGETHIFEPGGRGGVYQHTLAVAQLLSRNDRPVVIHTARDRELDVTGVRFCTCFDWHRETRSLRSLRIVFHYLLQVVPHLAKLPGGQQLWIQGSFKPSLTLALLVVLRLARRRAIFSPHNLFVRDGRRVSSFLLGLSLRVATDVVVYNSTDQARLNSMRVRCHRIQLLQYAPDLPAPVIRRWARRVERMHAAVCSVGHLRPDKNLDLLVSACRRAGLGLLLAGADHGAAQQLRAAISVSGATPVHLHVGYLEFVDLAAIIKVTGVVALPHSVASQSGVAEVARSYGATVVAYDAGGLSEQADILVPDLEPGSWAEALSRAVADAPHRQPPITGTHQGALRALLQLLEGAS